jgi:hypothetical protein
MTPRKLLVDICVLVVSAAVAVLLCEFIARRVFNAADYLWVEMVPDTVLGAVPSATAKGGFDAWGFRNRAVPRTVDIVAIGDSHTYGNTATMGDSWPYVAARLAGQSVYNMGLGGYGPNQYYQLLQSRALTLKPRTIICGLYMGDDFENAFLMTYGLDYWAELRQSSMGKAQLDIWDTHPPPAAWNKRVREWLSGHSVVYQLVVHGPIVSRIQTSIQSQNARQSSGAVWLRLPEKQIQEAFLPLGMLSRLNQDSPQIREGMRITFALIGKMNDLARRNGIEFMVVVIPTKEMVFSEDVAAFDVPSREVIASLLKNERLARQKTFSFLSEARIRYVDALPALAQARNRELYVRSATDMHPSKNGYQVIGETVFQALKAADVQVQ